MSAAALGGIHDPLLPQTPGGMAPGAVLALAAHVALVAALVWGLNWRTQAPDVVAAELWAAVPQMAAPRAEELPAPPTPAPTPEVVQPKIEALPDPQIAIEHEKKIKRERAEREAREVRDKKAAADKALAEKAAQQAAETRLARQRDENLKRMLGQAGAGGAATGSAAQDAAPSRSYAGRLVAHIKPNIVFTDTLSGNPAAEVEVRAGPSGAIVARRLLKSSGNKEWDEAVLRAIDRTGTLPRDVDGRVPQTLQIVFRPND